MVKYTKVKFDKKKILKLYADGKCVSDIAQAIGYPVGVGQNRTRKVLEKAGVYKPVRKAAK